MSTLPTATDYVAAANRQHVQALTPAAEYPKEPVLAFWDEHTGWEYGYLIPVEDQWAYECEGCGSTPSVIIWGPDCLANCVACVRESDEALPAFLPEQLQCAYNHDDGPITVSGLVLHGDRLMPACAWHVAQYEASPTQATDPDSHLTEKRVIRL